MNGLMYGTTLNGGCSSSSCVGSCNCGTIYTITPSGTVRQIYAFISLEFDGGLPSTGLTYLNGGFYGTTRYTIFKIRPSGRFYTLHRFHGGADGAQPEGDLLAFNGSLYGTAFAGGTGCAGNGCGVVFKLSTSGKERILYRFKGGADGRNPSAGLIAFNNQLYGTTSAGGSCNGDPSGCGTIFAVNPSSGAERVLYRFKGGTDGEQPGRGRLIAVNATLYGTTAKGGMKHRGTVFSFVP